MSSAVLAPTPFRRPVEGRPARPVPASARPVTELRLTRRGRLLVLATLVVAALLAITVGQAVVGAFSAEAGSSSSTDAARTWVVEPGETLWSIAQQLDPNTDPRETVARIESMNDLSGSGVLAGQEIFVPGP